MKTINKNLFHTISITVMLIAFLFLGFSIYAQEQVSQATFDEVKKANSGLEVTVMMYSGIKNPTFMIKDPKMIGYIKSMVTKSQRWENKRQERVIPSQLGYTGIRVRVVGHVPSWPDLVELNTNKKKISLMSNLKDGSSINSFYSDNGDLEDILLDLGEECNALDGIFTNSVRQSRK